MSGTSGSVFEHSSSLSMATRAFEFITINSHLFFLLFKLEHACVPTTNSLLQPHMKWIKNPTLPHNNKIHRSTYQSQYLLPLILCPLVCIHFHKQCKYHLMSLSRFPMSFKVHSTRYHRLCREDNRKHKHNLKYFRCLRWRKRQIRRIISTTIKMKNFSWQRNRAGLVPSMRWYCCCVAKSGSLLRFFSLVLQPRVFALGWIELFVFEMWFKIKLWMNMFVDGSESGSTIVSNLFVNFRQN